jgi:hypothetical protein
MEVFAQSDIDLPRGRGGRDFRTPEEASPEHVITNGENQEHAEHEAEIANEPASHFAEEHGQPEDKSESRKFLEIKEDRNPLDEKLDRSVNEEAITEEKENSDQQKTELDTQSKRNSEQAFRESDLVFEQAKIESDLPR